MYKGIALALAALILSPTFAAAQQPGAAAGAVKATEPGKALTAVVVDLVASVEAVDRATRLVTLKGPEDRVVSVVAGPEVRNFDQIRVGDRLRVRYEQALLLELKKGGAGVRTRRDVETGDRAALGQKPGATAGREVHVTADVVGLDPKTQTVTLRGPNRTVELKVKDPEQFKLVQKGDQVEATFVEAVAISVKPEAK